MKPIIATILDYGCTLTRHAGTCGLVSDAWRFRFDETTDEWRFEITNPLWRVWLWAHDIDLMPAAEKQ